jgi:YD repeat-containing protein
VEQTNPSGETKSVQSTCQRVRNGRDRAMFSERGWDVVFQQYSTRGLLTSTSEPVRVFNQFLSNEPALLSGVVTTTLKYDRLGRPITKLAQRVSRSTDITTTSYGSTLLYRTEYVHNSFKTDIKVCGVVSGTSNVCPGGATNVFGKVLSMSREFDESGAVIKTVDANNGITQFFYDAAHSPVRLTDAENFATTAFYNNVGHRTSVTDPNRGTWSYEYNGFGELKKQRDARTISTPQFFELSQVFDNLGRLTSRNWTQPDRFNPATPISLSDTFTYNNSTVAGGYGTLISAVRSGEGTVTESYLYDGLNRPVRKNYVGSNVASRSWTMFETTEYDPNFGRPVRKNFPSAPGIEAQKIYMGYTLGGDPMQTGYADRYLPSDPRSSNPTRYLRRDEAANARGQMLTSRFGSGDNSQAYQWLVSEYDLNTGWLLSRCSNLTVCAGVAQSGSAIDTAATMKLGYEYDIFGNLSKSVNVGKRPGNVTNGGVTSEIFTYDELHRMTLARRSIGSTAQTPVSYSYSAVGNLQKKTDFSLDAIGAYNYGSTVPMHGVKQVALQGTGTMFYGYDANGNVNGRGRSTTFTDTFGYDINSRHNAPAR